MSAMSVLVVTGTDTGVGKTVVTAALAALARSVAVVKPVQTGLAEGEPGDLAEVVRLAGTRPGDTRELARYPDPLSPEAAARRSGRPALALANAVCAVTELAARYELVLVEGAGGLLVRFGPDGWTIADLATATGADVLLVVRAGLGTLNHTALTAEACSARGLRLAGVVIGSWPARPDLAAVENPRDLPVAAAAPLLGALPEGAASHPDFAGLARAGLAPELGGEFDSILTPLATAAALSDVTTA